MRLDKLKLRQPVVVKAGAPGAPGEAVGSVVGIDRNRGQVTARIEGDGVVPIYVTSTPDDFELLRDESPTSSTTSLQKVRFAVLCDYAFPDAHGKLCMMGVFRNINVPAVPGGIPQFFYVGEVVVHGTEGSVDVALEKQDRSWEWQIFEAEFKGPPTPVGTRAENPLSLLFPIMGVVFPAEGHYDAVLKEGDRVIHRQDFTVQVPPPPVINVDPTPTPTP